MDQNVFISYSSSDKKIADAICAALEANNTGCWIAPRDILPGTEYGEAIINGIEACRIFLLVFSSRANDSPQVRREVERAVSKGKSIISLRIEAVLPAKALEFALSNTHWLDAIDCPVESISNTLLNSVHHLLKTKDPHPLSFQGSQPVKTDTENMITGQDSWIMRTTNGPGERSDFGMIYDYRSEMILLHGGFGKGNADNHHMIPGISALRPVQSDSWTWDGESWRLSTSGTLSLVSHAMAHDRKRGQNVILGGWTGSQRIKGTFILVKDNWIPADAGNAFETGGFQNHALAFDEKRNTVLLFGGLTISIPGGQRALGETLEWNGTVWRRLHVDSPEPRWGHKMIYDQDSGVIVLFGGTDGKSFFNDTWTWEGHTATWKKVASEISPSARTHHGMLYDALKNRVLLIGGMSADKLPLGDLWEWNGKEWILLMNQVPPKPRYNHGFAYDEKRNKSILYGGTDGIVTFCDTWEFGS
ncbi:TIR domain-containing protein [bacterium]|nr:TIR domain-containing protein [bacterium]